MKDLSAMWETLGPIPGSGGSLEKRMGSTHSSIESCSHEVELYDFFIYFGYYLEGPLLKYSSV